MTRVMAFFMLRYIYALCCSRRNLSLSMAMNSPLVGLSSLVATLQPKALFRVGKPPFETFIAIASRYLLRFHNGIITRLYRAFGLQLLIFSNFFSSFKHLLYGEKVKWYTYKWPRPCVTNKNPPAQKCGRGDRIATFMDDFTR